MREAAGPERRGARRLLRRGAVMLGDFVLRALVLALVWWAISEGQREAAGFGAVMVLLAVAVSFALAPGSTFALRPLGFAQFVPFFLWQSLRGGFDVVRRAVDPRMPLSPTVISYPLRLQGRVPRVAMALTLSLMPGTLAVRIHGQENLIRIHVLDDQLPVTAAMAALENRLAAAFGQRLDAGSPS